MHITNQPASNESHTPKQRKSIVCSPDSTAMSFTFIATLTLLGSSVVIAFILQPSKEDSATSDVSLHRCQGESLQSIRKGLLEALNLQAEPWLPAGALEGVRQQWRNTFSTIAHTPKDSAVSPVSGYSVSTDGGNSTNLRCCSMATEVFMKDLGWDNWVIHPASLTILQCTPCTTDGSTVQCPSPHASAQDANSQVQMPCCQPTSQEMVPVIYMDEFSTLVISSVHLTRSCGCGSGSIQQRGRV